MQNKTLLVIDDDRNVLKNLEQAFQAGGFTVLTANTATKGLQLYAKSHPDLLILDILLPDMSGISLLNQICNRDGVPSVPVVVLSGRPNMDKFFDGMKMVEFVQKPYSILDLMAKITDILSAAATARPEGAPPPSELKGCRAVLVEEDGAVMASLFLSTKLGGMEVEVVRMGSEAVERILLSKPDLVIMNRILSGMNGDAVIEALNAIPQTRDIPIMVYDLSGFSSTGSDITSRYSNVVCQLTGIETGRLLDKIKEVLRKKHAKPA